MTTATATATFETGATYTCRSVADHTTRWTFTVAKRSAKFVTLVRDNGAEGETLRVGIRTDERGEWTMPLGTYSMAPVLRATEAVPAPAPVNALEICNACDIDEMHAGCAAGYCSDCCPVH